MTLCEPLSPGWGDRSPPGSPWGLPREGRPCDESSLPPPSPAGWILIDRCGKHFGTILNYLRDGAVPLPESRREIEELLAEAKYYLVQGLVEECQAALQVGTAHSPPCPPPSSFPPQGGALPTSLTSPEGNELTLELLPCGQSDPEGLFCPV